MVLNHNKKDRAATIEVKSSKQAAKLALARLSPLYVKNDIWSSVRISEYRGDVESIEHLSWDKAALSAYSRFGKLYGERKYATYFSEPTMSRTFFYLPAEIRNCIYRLVLIPDPAYIDLAPKTNEERSNGKACNHHMKRMRKKITPNLRLLRTCHQVHKEASAIFYGETEWRFTNVRGAYVLHAFLRRIGRQNISYLRKLTIHVPWSGQALEHYNNKDGLPESHGVLKHMYLVTTSMGLRPPHWEATMRKCLQRITRHLEDCGTLRELRLVLPDSYELSGHREYLETSFTGREAGAFLDASKFHDGLKVTLVRLHGGFVTKDRHQQHLEEERRLCIATHEPAKRAAMLNGWPVVIEAYDRLGHYPIPLPKGDVVAEFPYTGTTKS